MPRLPRRPAIGPLAALAAAAAVVLAAERPAPEQAPRMRLLAADGAVRLTNSREGASVVAAAGLAPGTATSGTVRIANAGTLAGSVTVQAANLADTPGELGGLLSGRLRLVLRDATEAGAEPVVYSGPLAMPVQPLGTFGPGQERTYRFEVSFPDGGVPAPSSSGDNAYGGSAARVDFRWQATAEESPAPATPSGAPASQPPEPGGAPPAPPGPPIVTGFAVLNRRFAVRVPGARTSPRGGVGARISPFGGLQAPSPSPGTRADRQAATPPLGSAFRYTVSVDAGVRIVVERAACPRPSGCTRYREVTALSRLVGAGTSTTAFSGWLGTRPLPPGYYRATIVARDYSGRLSSPRRAAFTIVADPTRAALARARRARCAARPCAPIRR